MSIGALWLVFCILVGGLYFFVYAIVSRSCVLTAKVDKIISTKYWHYDETPAGILVPFVLTGAFGIVGGTLIDCCGFLGFVGFIVGMFVILIATVLAVYIPEWIDGKEDN